MDQLGDLCEPSLRGQDVAVCSLRMCYGIRVG